MKFPYDCRPRYGSRQESQRDTFALKSDYVSVGT